MLLLEGDMKQGSSRLSNNYITEQSTQHVLCPCLIPMACFEMICFVAPRQTLVLLIAAFFPEMLRVRAASMLSACCNGTTAGTAEEE